MTATQQIALASVISSGAVGLAAVLGSVLSAWRDRRHMRDLAHQARQQERLERTYLELLAYIHHRRIEANSLQPLLGPAAAPAQTTHEEIARVQALVMAHASKEVRELLDEFNDVLVQIINANIAIEGMRDEQQSTGRSADPAAWGGSMADYRKRIQADKQRLSDVEDRLHAQVRQELATL